VRTLAATRYVTPLREGGSLPAVIEADDGGTWVLKFRGAGQGAKALIAELIAGEIGRALGLLVPELALVELDSVLGRNEPDSEIQALLRASGGLNLGVAWLPGAIGWDPSLGAPPQASEIVWFDAFCANVDRTARNPNLLLWHKQVHLIDHGAALYYQHDSAHFRSRAADPFAAIRDHVLLPCADRLAEADADLAPLLTVDRLRQIVALVPDLWLEGERQVYVDFLARRLTPPRAFVEEAIRAHHV
jgi:HipA-like kinase